MRGYGAQAMRIRRGRLRRTGNAAYIFANAEAAAFVARMTAAPGDSYKAAYDRLWTRLKTGAVNGTNIAGAFDIFYVRAAPTAQAALLNMMSPSFSATLSPTPPPFHAGYGFTTNGIDSYVEWGGWRPSDGVQFAQNSASLGFWARSPDASSTGTQPDVGTVTGNVFVCGRNSTGAAVFRINDAASTSVASSPGGDGFFCAVRPDGATKRLFRGNAQFGTDSAVASSARSAVIVREGNAFATFAQDQLPFAFAGRALTAGEVVDLHAALTEYLAAIGWQPLFAVPGGDAAIRAAATALPAYTSRVPLPDAVPTIVSGKGFTCTGACLDPRDGTWWVSAFGRNVQGDSSTPFQPYVVRLAADRATALGTINLVALTIPAVGIQGITFDSSDNTLWVAGGGNVYHIAASTASPSLLGSFAAPSTNGLAYDAARDRLVRCSSSALSYLNKDGTTTNLPSLQAAIPGGYGDQIARMADLDAFLVTGGPNGSDGVIARIGMNDQNFGALRVSALYTAPGHSAIEGIHRDPATKTATIFNDWWYHGSTGALPNGSAVTQLPI